jgi:hypothetical protein
MNSLRAKLVLKSFLILIRQQIGQIFFLKMLFLFSIVLFRIRFLFFCNNFVGFAPKYLKIAAKRKREPHLDSEEITGVAPEWVGNPFATDAFDASGQTDNSRAFAVKSKHLFTIDLFFRCKLKIIIVLILCVMRYTFHFFSRSRQMSNLLIHFPKSLI